MKRNALSRRTLLATVAAATATVALTSCGALWDTSVGVEAGGPYYEWDGEWLPTLAGDPVYSPFYYGGTSYPINTWQPIYRPGLGPWGGPAGGPAAPLPDGRPDRPSGNVRPSTPSVPSTPSAPATRPLYPSNPLDGSNPGIQLPPAGTGYRTPGRH